MPFSSIRIPAIMPPQALLCVMVLLVVTAFPVAAALPQGCSVDGTTLVSCRGFTGTQLHVQWAGLTKVQSGAFDGLTVLTALCVPFQHRSLVHPTGG